MEDIENEMKYAQVIVDIPALELNMKTFSYLIPDDLKGKVIIGSPVSVPFGNQDPVFGYVVGFTNYIPEHIRVKNIFELLDNEPLFDLKYLQFIEWVANYYSASLVSALSAAIPSNLWSSAKRIVFFQKRIDLETIDTLKPNEKKICNLIYASKKQELGPSTISHKLKITKNEVFKTIRTLKSKEILDIKTVYDSVKPKTVEFTEIISENTDNKRYKQILETLKYEFGGICQTSELVKISSSTRPTIKKMVELGLIKFELYDEYRNPLQRFSETKKDPNKQLTEEQKIAFDGLLKDLSDAESTDPILLFGVTGSGKTEVYFQVMEKILEKGQSIIFLVPEITLTSQISSRIIARFGHDKVGIWHSAISSGEKLDVWRKITSGKIKILLGARSAIFAPVKNLGLVVIDEEHESSYKQDTPSPRYHAREVAIERAKRYNAKVLLGSATPDVSSYYRSININKIHYLRSRVEERPMAQISLVDMKQELENGNKTIFSRLLSYEIQEKLAKKEQIILLINRRGFNTYVFCRACGYVAQCKHCAIPLIYHTTTDQLQCHYCNYKIDNLKLCPSCESGYIRHYGLGTQRVEKELQNKFPQAKLLRLDSDVTTKKNAHYEIIESFGAGDADILIGTQMVAKGLDLPEVTLVGVLSADSSFNFPDYRSMERGFQLLTQVAGRSGRGLKPGKVIFQCYSPGIYPVACAQKQDYFSFYSLEILEREKYNYPPYSQLVRIILSSEDFSQTFSESMKLYNHLYDKFVVLEEKIQLLGPSECVISKIQNNYRIQILIKNLLSSHGHSLILSAIKEFDSDRNVRLTVDIDPLNML